MRLRIIKIPDSSKELKVQGEPKKIGDIVDVPENIGRNMLSKKLASRELKPKTSTSK